MIEIVALTVFDSNPGAVTRSEYIPSIKGPPPDHVQIVTDRAG